MQLQCTLVLLILTCSNYVNGIYERGTVTNIVETEYGPVRGYLRQYDEDGYYFSYRGVPYAEQPIGKLRFESLIPPKPWKKVFDAKHEGPICIQPNVFYGPLMEPGPMSEACIHVNIHVPSDQREGLKPVYVYIHGGGFNYGSSNADLYGPEYFMRTGIIVVTFNYRIGVLGFLSLGIREVPGNEGLKDMVFLLEWLQRNIKEFGGDPRRVTVGGNSSGSSSAHLLTLSPLGEGLLHRTIYQSGTAISSYVCTNPAQARDLALRFAAYMNITSTDPYEIYNQLKYADAERILEASQNLIDEAGSVTFVPVVEKKFNGVKQFLNDKPKNIITNKKAQDISTLIGTTNEECIGFYKRLSEVDIEKAIIANKTLLVPTDILYDGTEKIVDKVQKLIENTYFDGWFSLRKYIQLLTDVFFHYPTVRLARLHNLYLESKMYIYRFGLVTKLNQFKFIVSGKQFYGASHVDDVNYVFKCNSCNYTIERGTYEDYANNLMVQLLANFIKYGNPTPEKTDIIPTIWPPTNSYDVPYLDIDCDVKVRKNMYPDMIQYWDKIYNYLENAQSL